MYRQVWYSHVNYVENMQFDAIIHLKIAPVLCSNNKIFMQAIIYFKYAKSPKITRTAKFKQLSLNIYDK